MNRAGFARSAVEQVALKNFELFIRVTLVGNTVVANLSAFTDAGDGALAYVEATGQPTPADTGATFGTLDSNAAPSTVGILVMDGFFERLDDASVVNISSAQMTAGVVTKVGASSTGITASGNIAVVVSCTTLDLDSATANHSFTLILRGTRKVSA